jgi:hypothetical protein
MDKDAVKETRHSAQTEAERWHAVIASRAEVKAIEEKEAVLLHEQSALLKECEKERKKIEEQRKSLLKQREDIEEEGHEKKEEEEFYVGELDNMMMEYNRRKPK